MEAEFAESENSYFPLSLITSAIDESRAYTDFTEYISGKRLYVDWILESTMITQL